MQEGKVYSSLKDIVWYADVADMQLISNYIERFRFVLCVIDVYSRYAWTVPSKDKESILIENAFQNAFDDSNRKPNKLWLDRGSEYYNRSMKS